MSGNQSRADKNEPPHYRRSARSANPASPRNFSGGGGRGGGGGSGSGSTTAPPSSAFSSGKSFKKVVSNAQGGHSRPTGQNPNPNVNLGSVNSSSTGGRVAPNGGHVQPPSRGTTDASSTGVAAKPTDASVQKSTPGLPKAPQSNAVPPASSTTGATGPATPVKGSGDASKAFSLQFGSISPGVMNGMQVPARTNSAPPNMDEQKRAQARLDSSKATSFANPALPKQEVPRKDVGPVNQPNRASEARPISKEKKDVSTPIAAHNQKPTGPPMPSIPGVSMQIPFHQSPVHHPFGSPNPPLQSQNMANTSLPVQLPMHLPIGNSQQGPPQVFLQGMHHHHHHHQGMIHPSQGLTFSPQMVPQIGNMGMPMGLGPQFQQQQPTMGNLIFGSPQRTVKITHPDTHEELRLEKRNDGYPNGESSVGPRSNPQGPTQPQTVTSFPSAHPINYYSNPYNANSLYFPPHSTQSTPSSQAPRFYNQQASKQVTVKPAVSSHGEKVGDSSPAVVKVEIPKSQRTGVEVTSAHPHKNLETITGSPSAPVEDAMPLVNSQSEGSKQATANKSGSCKEEEKQPSKEITSLPVEKIDEQSPIVSSSPLETSNNVTPSNAAGDSASACDIKEDGLKSTEIIGSGTHSDNTHKVEGPIVENIGSKESVDQVQDSSVPELATTKIDAGFQKEPVNNDDILSGSIPVADLDVLNAETSSLSLESSHDDKISNLDDSASKVGDTDVDQVNSKEPVTSVEEDSRTVLVSVPEISALTVEVEATGSISPTSSKVKGNAAKGKKKIKDILKNADAHGTSDLYNAYKRPEEKKETSSAEIVENPPVKDISSDERPGTNKLEPDDWEDAADISAPKMETGLKRHSEDDNDGMTKKYSRDFLLKFSNHCIGLPEDFVITPDINEVLIASNANTPRESYPSPGKGGDRSGGGPRLDRRPSNLGLDDRRNKGSGPMVPGWDPRFGPGANHGVLRTPRGQPSVQYAGGILYAPMQSPGPQGGPTQRNNSDSDKWQRATGYQKGLMPSPHTPVMHKAERKYEVGKITDEEQAKQRQLKSILNKLTPQNFEKLFEQVKQVNIDNANTLSGVIGQIFDKALMEPTFVEMYANFCSRLSVELPAFGEDNEKITFRRLLLNKCQEEFERGVREQEEANRTEEEEGEVKQTEQQREEKRVKARRRMLGNIRLIGELYKMKMLTERIMHECIKKLLGQYENPDEEDIESLCKLMSTIGVMIDHQKAKDHIDAYFNTMYNLSNNMQLSSRVRFMLKDAIDLRKNKWQQRRKVEGPKKIDEVHRDAAQERQDQSSRLTRGPNSSPSIRRSQMDFSPRPSNVLPSNPQMGGFRGLPQHQFRAYGNQDPRFDAFENRTLSVPVRPMGGDDSITLGPQGGLARGMSVRGQPSMQGMQLHDMDSRRSVGGPNGYGATLERPGYGPHDDLASRYMPERFSPRPDPSSIQEHNMNYANRDMRNTGRGFDQVSSSSPPERTPESTPLKSGPVSEDHLHDKSIEAIKEFYSARDVKEIALCIKELNAPSFYPTMIASWVTDSFERKDMDRDSLAKLLIDLAKSHDGILNQDSFIKGFKSVLSTLEDSVNDAPKAAEFLGRIFARILLENVVLYEQVWRLIYEGGEEQGQLVEVGLAAEVLGVILEIIQSEKGDPFIKDLRESSDPRFENFRSPSSKKTSRLDKFI